jgi:hypothetical protein
MRVFAHALCALAVAGLAAAEPSQTRAPSEFAPGRITRATGGWIVEANKTRTFVSDRSLREAPDELAPIAALIPGRIEERAWGWVIYSREGRVDVFKERDGFTVTTPRESFLVIRRFARNYVLSPGRPNERRISIEEYIDTLQDSKKQPARR